jgi:hypothetical protein
MMPLLITNRLIVPRPIGACERHRSTSDVIEELQEQLRATSNLGAERASEHACHCCGVTNGEEASIR